MEAFAELLDRLVTTQGRHRKIGLMADYFRRIPDPDRGWALATLTDGLPLRIPVRRVMTDLMGDRIDPVLYKLSRDYVGDTAETVALLWPEPPAGEETAVPGDGVRADADGNGSRWPGTPTLGEAVGAIAAVSPSEVGPVLAGLLDRLDASGRFALLKLIGGAPRVGVSARLARTALGAAYGRETEAIEEVWHALTPPYAPLFAWLEGRAGPPDLTRAAVFRPMMLAHPIEEGELAALDPAEIVAEWKWDGIRVQVAATAGDVRLFSRTGDDISPAFPELRSAFLGLEVVVDGELLVLRSGAIAPFSDLQQRLNRKVVGPKLLRQHPAHIRLYDLLFEAGEDLRAMPLDERRARLETWHGQAAPPLTDLSPAIPFGSIAELSALWSAARDGGIEGLMLKRKASPYLAGRPKGHWWKWKRAPLTADCVLMYAQRGSGKRSSLYSDYTFGVWRQRDDGGRELVPVGKAYSGFTDDELVLLDRWIRTNTTERFGPVRAVAPGLVLEVAFDAVNVSARHKSGVAMRFPRIARIRWDKPADEADWLDTMVRLLPVE